MVAMRSALLLVLAVLAGCATRSAPEPCDLLITGGMVVDGTGALARRADVAVRDGHITRVGIVDPERFAATVTLDATGLVVTPGFIDVHAHGDPLRTPKFANFISMGVTTICLGQDGSSADPAKLGAWLERVDQRRPAVNIATLVGHGSVRHAANVPDGRAATATERERMAQLAEIALDSGAFGLSTGIEYVPGRFADLDELVAVARPVGTHGAVVMSHVRSEDDGDVEDSVRELLEQCRRAGARAHLSHAKVVYGKTPARAEAVLALLDAARATGMEVTADVYPYVASFTGLSILFPEWALPPNDYAQVVRDRRDELAAYLRERVTARNGPEATLFGSGPWPGKTLAEVAEQRHVPFEDVLIELGPDGASAAYFVMDEAVMERFLADPFVMVASDGSPTMRHPRGHGTFAKILRAFVVERPLLTLEEAVRKTTSLPADTLGLKDRGRVAEGDVADLLVFDPAAVRDTATFEKPFARAEGFRDVLVNGVFVVRDGEPTGQRPGHALRSRQSAAGGGAPR